MEYLMRHICCNVIKERKMRISSAQFVLVVEASFWLLKGRLRAENWFISFFIEISKLSIFYGRSYVIRHKL